MCKAFQIYDNLSQIDDNLEKFAFNSQISMRCAKHFKFTIIYLKLAVIQKKVLSSESFE